MSIAQLLELHSEIDLENIFNQANDSENFWDVASDEDKYLAYISVYYKFHKDDNQASFANFVRKIDAKMKYIKVAYAEICANVTDHQEIYMNEIIHSVEENEKTWVEGLSMLFTIYDMQMYGW